MELLNVFRIDVGKSIGKILPLALVNNNGLWLYSIQYLVDRFPPTRLVQFNKDQHIWLTGTLE